MRFILILTFSLFYASLLAQFGIRSSYGVTNSGQWNDEYQTRTTTEGHFLNTTLEMGIDYWLRLKNVRVEFLPMVYASIARHTPDNQALINRLSKGNVGIKLNTYFYPFDFMGDCDCPTFSKQGNYFSKGFYLNVAPGISYNRMTAQTKADSNDPEYSHIDSNDINMVIGIGAGLDIGVTDLLTLSPFVQWDYYPGLNWNSFSTIIQTPGEVTKANISTLHLGLRVGIRPDYESNKRRRRF